MKLFSDTTIKASQAVYGQVRHPISFLHPFYNSWSSKWLTIDKATYIAICANSKKSNRWKTSTIMCCNDVLRIFLMFYSVFTKIFCMMCRYSIINMTFIRAWLVITLGLHHRLWLKWKEESIQGIENRRINRSAS